jgi:hypothetical protein
MEINVGEYVRDKNGIVGKVYDITNEPSVDIGIGIMPEVNAVWIDKDKIKYLNKEDITKHSKDIIDLIEVGDYVNGREVTSFGYDHNDKRIYVNTISCLSFENDEIETVLTKQQFEANAYKIEKEV